MDKIKERKCTFRHTYCTHAQTPTRTPTHLGGTDLKTFAAEAYVDHELSDHGWQVRLAWPHQELVALVEVLWYREHAMCTEVRGKTELVSSSGMS